MRRLAPAVALIGALASAGAPAAAAEERSFRLAIAATAPAEAPVFAVRRGDIVAITVESALSGDVHLHGYNREARLAAGGTVSWRFTAHATGRYPIEFHGPGEAAGHRHGRARAYLEVRPR